MELDLTTEQRQFRDELRGYFADMMTDALTRELSGGWEGGGPEFRRVLLESVAGLKGIPAQEIGQRFRRFGGWRFGG